MIVSMLPVNVLAEALAEDEVKKLNILAESFEDNLNTVEEYENPEFVVDSFTFRVLSESRAGTPGTVKIIDFLDQRDPLDENYGVVVIPETINYLGFDYTVESIAGNAFVEALRLQTVVVPDSITSVGEKLFEEKGTFVLYCNSGSFIEKYLQDKQYAWITIITDGIKLNL